MIEKIQKAFSPTHEIEDPYFFVGRHNEIKNTLKSLSSQTFMAIFGLRGVGKSSFARQIKNIAEGDETLIKSCDLKKYLPHKGFNYLTRYLKCDSSIKNTGDILKRLIFGDDSNESLFTLTNAGDKKIDKLIEEFKGGGSAKLFGIGLDGNYSSKVEYSQYVTDDIKQLFRQLLGIIQKDNYDKSGLLILIDEFDIIEDTTDFASLVKSCTNDFIKFGIIGIANSITELIAGHSSIGRLISPIEIPKMDENELHQIIDKAESIIGQEMKFDNNAKIEIVRHADGFPYFVHLVGKESLFLAFDNEEKMISKENVVNIQSQISQGKLQTIYEDIYHSAVKNSPQREILLKLFAEDESTSIFSEEVYATAKELEVSNPSQLMKELTNPQDGSIGVLTKIRDKYYRFTDPVFKVYAKMRTMKFN